VWRRHNGKSQEQSSGGLLELGGNCNFQLRFNHCWFPRSNTTPMTAILLHGEATLGGISIGTTPMVDIPLPRRGV
jgi:hypothetical protein